MIVTTTETIDAQKAKQYLAHNTCNRPIIKTNVATFVRLIRSASFYLAPHGISFSDTQPPCLIDGQHRLLAVIEANIACQFRVHRNVPHESRIAIDIGGRKRTPRDLNAIMGNAAWHQSFAAIARVAKWGVSLSGLVGPDGKAPAPEEVVNAVSEFYPALDFCISKFGTMHKRGICQASVLGAIARAKTLAQEHENALLERFCDILTGAPIADVSERAAATLREWLLQRNPNIIGSQARRAMYLRTQRAILAFYSGEELRALVTPKDDLF